MSRYFRVKSPKAGLNELAYNRLRIREFSRAVCPFFPIVMHPNTVRRLRKPLDIHRQFHEVGNSEAISARKPDFPPHHGARTGTELFGGRF